MQVAFLNLPTTDLFSAPNQHRLEEGVAWMIDETSSGKGSVYVHCKAGRARSATLVAAYLIQVLAACYYMPYSLHCRSMVSELRRQLQSLERLDLTYCYKANILMHSEISTLS